MSTFPRQIDPARLLAQTEFSAPPARYAGPPAMRDSRTLFSALSPGMGPGCRLLDLGCGPRDQATPAEYLGYEYVGIDLFGTAADIRADAHAVPFRDGTFDVVFSYAVLEHLHNPFVALAEVRRVLRPGGAFVGTVSLGEPFHSSFLHHTPWGLVSAAASVGLTVERLWPSIDTLGSLAAMGSYSRPVRWALRALDLFQRATPFLTPRRWLTWTEKERQFDACCRAGSLCFAMRPQGSGG